MRELLQQASIHIRAWHKKYGKFQPQWLPPAKDVELLEAIDEALSRSKWVKVSDGLPVVPNLMHPAPIWIYRKDKVVRKLIWYSDFDIDMTHSFTHWQYRQDDTPAPPEDV